jgi:phosphomannomutase/phosphoglucomutase
VRREIFREYDIRGIAGRDLTPESVELIGRGIGTILVRAGKRSITVGRDCRLSSDSYRDALVAGLNGCGIAVVDIGVVPTPLLYFSIFHLASDGGVMITGSHNPSEYNGFKICVGTESIHGERIQEIYELIESRSFARGSAGTTSADVLTPYRKLVLDQIRLARPVRVAVDCGNGTAALLAPDLMRALGCEVVELYCDMDGRFPNHHPDPTVEENLRDLQRAVESRRVELGIAFDGDADRIGVVDEAGRVVWGDMLMLLYAREILGRKPGATFVSEVKCSMNLFRGIEQLGGRAIMWRTGHSLIKAKMREEGAALGGEMSGHMFFADRYLGYDDAVYAAARLLEIVAGSSRSVSSMLADVPPTVATPEIRIQCDDDRKFGVVERVKARFRQTNEVIDVDGARILFEKGWGLVRASNTQDVLVLRFEAADAEALAAVRETVETAVQAAKAESTQSAE